MTNPTNTTNPSNVLHLRPVLRVVPPEDRPHDPRVVDAVSDLLSGLAPGPCTDHLVSAVLHAPAIPAGLTLDDALAYVVVLGLDEGRGVRDGDDGDDGISRGPVYAAMAALAVRAGVTP